MFDDKRDYFESLISDHNNFKSTSRDMDYQYSLAGSSGRTVSNMACECCKQQIDTESQDWVCFQRHENYDWRYVLLHRTCSDDDTGWLILEERKAYEENRSNNVIRELATIYKKYGLFEEEEIEDLTLAALRTNRM